MLDAAMAELVDAQVSEACIARCESSNLSGCTINWNRENYMQNIYETTYNLTTNYYDPYNHLSVQGALDLLQNIAARHAYTLGAGKEDLEKIGLFWVIARTELDFKSFPNTPVEVKVITWPTLPTRFYFDRFYKIIDLATNEIILVGRSRWVLVDTIKRRIANTSLYQYPLASYHQEILFTTDFARLEEPSEEVGTHIVRPSEIDENGHLNNSKYGNIIYDYLQLQSNEVIKNIVIFYNNEALSGEKIILKKQSSNNKIAISGHKTDTIIFNSEVTIKQWVD